MINKSILKIILFMFLEDKGIIDLQINVAMLLCDAYAKKRFFKKSIDQYHSALKIAQNNYHTKKLKDKISEIEYLYLEKLITKAYCFSQYDLVFIPYALSENGISIKTNTQIVLEFLSSNLFRFSKKDGGNKNHRTNSICFSRSIYWNLGDWIFDKYVMIKIDFPIASSDIGLIIIS